MATKRKRSPKLATKLVAALLTPLVAVGVLAAVLVDSFSQDVDQAQAELGQVRTSIALSHLGIAIRDELSAIAFLPLVDITTDLNRQITDEAFASAKRVAGSDLTIIRTHKSRIEKSREVLGNRPATIRRWLADEVGSGETNGLVTQQIDLYRAASAAFLQAANFDAPDKLSGEAAASLATVQLISNYNSAIQAEYDAFQSFRTITDATVDRQVQLLAQDVRLASAKSEAAESAIFAIGSAQLRTELSNLRNTDAHNQTLELRRLVTTDVSGNAPTTRILRDRSAEISTNRLTNAIWAISSSLDIIRFQSVTDLELGAEGRRDSALLALRSTVIFATVLALLVVVIGFALYRSIRRPIEKLTRQSRRIASHDLPEVVTLMRSQGTDARLPTIEPIEVVANDEIGALVVAFNQMHSTAVQLAGEQAAARATVADMFVNLGRRNQKLLLRLLGHMDSLERRATDPDVLEELFKVDHLATRMRRNAESLLVLAGARSTRGFDRPLPLTAMLRASLSEVDGYERVRLNIADDVLIDANAIADISHLVAELVENALTFSPSSSGVEIAGRRGASSLLLAIADQGKGLTAEELEAANKRIADAAENTETPSRFLGHYVSGRLAARHGLELKLISGIPNGLICRIRIPAQLIVDEATGRAGVDESLAGQRDAGASDQTQSMPSLDVPVPSKDPAERPVAANDVPPKPRHRAKVDASVPEGESVSARPHGLKAILPGAAPETVTTEGPTSGALAGSRRRVPVSQRVVVEDVPPTDHVPDISDSEAPDSTPRRLLTSGRRQPGANLPHGLEQHPVLRAEFEQTRTMEEALTLTGSAEAVKSSFSGLQAAFQRAEHNSSPESLEDTPQSAEGLS